jgi:hypothetical protein
MSPPAAHDHFVAILLTDPDEVRDVADWLEHEARRRGPEGVAQSEVDAGFPGFDRGSVAAGVERACRQGVERASRHRVRDGVVSTERVYRWVGGTAEGGQG